MESKRTLIDFKSLLNEQQLAPVEDTEGAVLVLAGAGSGKTRVLTFRIAYLIQNKQIAPFNILAITFTNKAAAEMKERVASLVGQSDILISTFHSFCARILRWEISNLEGYNSNFSIYDDGDCGRIISRILKDMEIEDAKDLKKDIRWHISNAKNHALSPKDYAVKIKGEKNSVIVSAVFEQYEQQLRQNNALDFDDLLLKTVTLFANNKEVLRKYQQRYQYIMVDEFQDTNKIQYMLVRLLSAMYGNIFVVGDDDQSIYGWRWAEVENIINFKKHFAGARIYKLEQNYRSTANILNLANKIIENNEQRMGKTLWTDGENGVKVVYNSCYNERSEADYVVEQINSLIARNEFKYKDFAVLVRANSITRAVEEKLTLYNFPYRVIGGSKFYERKEVKDFLAYLKLVVNPSDTESILRVINTPKRGIGDGAVEKLVEACRSHGVTLMDGILNLESLDLASGVAKKLAT
ncbi:MAG: UvrD-helicase domain-containing protein, partial [Clostridia bacterium]